jgi:hypothetical protein
MVNDILQTPGQRMAGGWPGTWGNGQFGTGPCGEYCLSFGGMPVWNWEAAHEAAVILWPGYDLGTCISSRGDCGALDWSLAVFGVIPGGKGVSLGVKGAVNTGELLVKGAARGTRTVIGKLDDLKSLGPGERTMLDRLPNLGSPKANWAQNSGVLRQEMARGLPIRDATVDSAGRLINNTGFLRAERNLLETRGWSYDQATRMWYPPAGP